MINYQSFEILNIFLLISLNFCDDFLITIKVFNKNNQNVQSTNTF